MLAVISPAKKLATDSQLPPELTMSQPQYLNDAAKLAAIMADKSPADLSRLMSISDKLSQLNAARYQAWQAAVDQNTQPAVMMFQGDVYQGLDAESLTIEQLNYTQQHLCILSGLYGLLRPFDAIYPYRLEMGAKLTNSKGSNLYQFWSETLTSAINQLVEQQTQPTLIHLASNEYFSVINRSALTVRVIQPIFKDYKNGTWKIISFFAKRARGLMARYMALQNLNHPEQLKDFNLGGYSYNASMSTVDNWVFTRASTL